MVQTASQPVKMRDIASLFTSNSCPSLANKPKLFFIQACHGDEDVGYAFRRDSDWSEAYTIRGYKQCPASVSLLYKQVTLHVSIHNKK